MVNIRVWFVGLVGLTLMTAAPAMAKKKGKAAKNKPVKVLVKNTCEQSTTIKLDEFVIETPAKGETPAQDVPAAKKVAHQFQFGDTKSEAYVFLRPGGQYAITLVNCGDSGADVITNDLSERPTGISPNAAAKVRFRASRGKGAAPRFEYHTGERGRFKRLSLGMTSYVESKAGDFPYGLRLKAKRGRGILARVKKVAQLQPGHKYLIEASAVGRNIFVKVEDEGWDGKK
ncbi:MAG: hypothetical protein VX589_11515 [Myxococcota bacterium]|nr:hypothetical protein [Myxococcota bacterium]